MIKNKLKKLLGIAWIFIAVATIIILAYSAYINIDLQGTRDINRPVPWIIIITIFTPVCVGLAIFGWYAWNDEYKNS